MRRTAILACLIVLGLSPATDNELQNYSTRLNPFKGRTIKTFARSFKASTGVSLAAMSELDFRHLRCGQLTPPMITRTLSWISSSFVCA